MSTHSAEVNPDYAGLLLDSRPSTPNKPFQMETQYVPGALSVDEKGETYARVAPTSFPVGPDGSTVVLHRLTSYNKKALWDGVKAWFEGGAAVSGAINPAGAYVQTLRASGGSTWKIYAENTPKEKKVAMAWNSFAKVVAPFFDIGHILPSPERHPSQMQGHGKCLLRLGRRRCTRRQRQAGYYMAPQDRHVARSTALVHTVSEIQRVAHTGLRMQHYLLCLLLAGSAFAQDTEKTMQIQNGAFRITYDNGAFCSAGTALREDVHLRRQTERHGRHSENDTGQ